MTFGEVLDDLRAGRRATRRCWYGWTLELELTDIYGTGPSWIRRGSGGEIRAVDILAVDILANDWEVVP